MTFKYNIKNFKFNIKIYLRFKYNRRKSNSTTTIRYHLIQTIAYISHNVDLSSCTFGRGDYTAAFFNYGCIFRNQKAPIDSCSRRSFLSGNMNRIWVSASRFFNCFFFNKKKRILSGCGMRNIQESVLLVKVCSIKHLRYFYDWARCRISSKRGHLDQIRQ